MISWLMVYKLSATAAVRQSRGTISTDEFSLLDIATLTALDLLFAETKQQKFGQISTNCMPVSQQKVSLFESNESVTKLKG